MWLVTWTPPSLKVGWWSCWSRYLRNMDGKWVSHVTNSILSLCFTCILVILAAVASAVFNLEIHFFTTESFWCHTRQGKMCPKMCPLFSVSKSQRLALASATDEQWGYELSQMRGWVKRAASSERKWWWASSLLHSPEIMNQSPETCFFLQPKKCQEIE